MKRSKLKPYMMKPYKNISKMDKEDLKAGYENGEYDVIDGEELEQKIETSEIKTKQELFNFLQNLGLIHPEVVIEDIAERRAARRNREAILKDPETLAAMEAGEEIICLRKDFSFIPYTEKAGGGFALRY